MVEDDVEYDADAVLVRGVDEFDDVAPRAESRVDVEEMLDAVAVEGVEVAALLEHRAEPDRRDAELLQVVELGLHALDRAALPAVRSGLRPAVPAPALTVMPVRPCRGAVAPVEQRPRGFPAVAEPVHQQKIQELVPPVGRRRMKALPPGKRDVRAEAIGDRRGEHRVAEVRSHGTCLVRTAWT